MNSGLDINLSSQTYQHDKQLAQYLAHLVSQSRGFHSRRSYPQLNGDFLAQSKFATVGDMDQQSNSTASTIASSCGQSMGSQDWGLYNTGNVNNAYKVPPSVSTFNTKVDRTKFKTEMCKNWLEQGFCRYGPKCQFAHGTDEVHKAKKHSKQYKSKKCKAFHEKDYCLYGSRCQFKHEERSLEEIKSYDHVIQLMTFIQGHKHLALSNN